MLEGHNTTGITKNSRAVIAMPHDLSVPATVNKRLTNHGAQLLLHLSVQLLSHRFRAGLRCCCTTAFQRHPR